MSKRIMFFVVLVATMAMAGEKQKAGFVTDSEIQVRAEQSPDSPLKITQSSIQADYGWNLYQLTEVHTGHPVPSDLVLRLQKVGSRGMRFQRSALLRLQH
jgi:hypothetical protein